MPIARTLRRRLLLAATLPWLALPAGAQPTSGELPLRNLQIEVRQMQMDSRAGSGVGASGAIVLSPGQSAAQIGIGGGGGARQLSQSSSQMALVLNGRETRIQLGNSVPVRVVQSFVRDGRVHVLPGTLLIEAGSGFAARPLWRGGDTVELELGTALAGRGGAPSAGTSATVALPLGEWTPIAESDSTLDTRTSGGFSQGQQSGATRLQVHVRVTVR